MEPVLRELQRHRIDPSGPHPIARALQTGEAQVVPSFTDAFRGEIAEADENYVESLRRWPARSAVVVPLRARGRLLGTLALASFSTERAFSRDDIQLVEELAHRAALAVDNARLYRERSRMGVLLQESLLPSHIPDIPGMEVAAGFRPGAAGELFGGDFYDLFRAGGLSWVAVVGDVSGRGAEAAVLTALARSTLRAYGRQRAYEAADVDATPSAELARLNDALISEERDGRFCALVYARIEPLLEATTITLANAGSPPPLVLRRSGEVELVGPGGTALGLVPTPSLADTTIRLDEDEVLLLYTNGVSAHPDEDGELTAALEGAASLTTGEIVERVQGAAAAVRPGRPPDDVVVVAMKRSSALGSLQAGPSDG
jgi:serine phosphatase RsbU (regulator of sigma subunit)